MADPDQLPASLQEAVLALLCFDEKWGALAAAQVTSDHFDGLYRDAAVAVLGYRQRFGKPPGSAHLEHLLERLPGPASDRKTQAVRRISTTLLGHEGEINGEYIAGRAQDFVRRQTLKAALYDATDRYVQGNDDGLVEDIEQILHKALSQRQQTLDAGTFLSDQKRGFEFLNRQVETYSLGIKALERFGVGMSPKEMLLYIAPKSSGKSWFAVHCGRQALVQKLRVVHVTLEMGEPRVVERYYQSLFGIARSQNKYLRTVLEFDELDRLTDFSSRLVKPKLDFGDPQIRNILRKKMKPWGTRLGRLVIKEFPSGSLTISQLSGYLDFLEMTHKFIPHVLVIDYADLMKLDSDNYRHSLGQTYVELRGLGSRRNLAIVAPTQGNRSSLTAKKVSSSMVSEDIRKVNTADHVLTYSQSPAEKRLNLARLYVAHSRTGEDGAAIVLTQSYATGQYVLQSMLMQNPYWERLKELTGSDPEED